MTSVTKNDLNVLMELQDIDMEGRKIRTSLESLPGKHTALEAELSELEEAKTQKEAYVSELKKEYRANESELQLNQEQIKKSNDKLASVKTNKEYQAILKEIEDLNKMNAQIEDDMLKNLELMEEEEETFLAQQVEFDQAQAQIREEKEAIDRQSEQEGKTLANLDKSWGEMAERVNPGLLKRFNAIRGEVRGAAVVTVNDAVCKGCHMNIPPQMYNELQRCDTLTFCPHCHRIIFWQG